MTRKSTSAAGRNGADRPSGEQPFQHIVASVAGVHKADGAVASAFDRAHPVRGRRAAATVDLDAVEIRHEVALPHPRVNRGNGYRRLLERMGVGDSVVLPKRAAMTLVTHAKAHGYRVAYRTLDAESAGVWRLS